MDFASDYREAFKEIDYMTNISEETPTRPCWRRLLTENDI